MFRKLVPVILLFSITIVQPIASNAQTQPLTAIAVGSNADGRLELIGLTKSKEPYHLWQTAPNGGWTPKWESMNDLNHTQILVSSNADGRLEVFALLGDKGAAHRSQIRPNDGWAAWSRLGGTDLQQLSVGRDGDGRIHLFAIGGDGSAYHLPQTEPNGSWDVTRWTTLGGTELRQLTVGKNDDGRLELFALGGDHGAYHTYQKPQDGNWHEWETLGGTNLQYLTSGNSKDGRIQLFARGGDGSAYNLSQLAANAGWDVTRWTTLGGTELRPMLVSGHNADGRLELFAVGGDRGAYHTYQKPQDGTWHEWESLGGTDLQQLAVGNDADGRIELFAIGGDGAAYHLSQLAPNGGWDISQWTTLGGPSAPIPPPLLTVDFHVEPHSGSDRASIYLGDSVTLSWSVNGCLSCQITLKGFGGVGYAKPILSASGLSPQGSLVLKPQPTVDETNTKYDLSATGTNDSKTKTVYVDQYRKIDQPMPSSGATFCFKISNPNTLGLPCYTVCLQAKDETTAKQIEKNIWGMSYTVDSISQSDFSTACTSQGATAKATTNTIVSSSLNPSSVGQSVTFTANVSSQSATPTGSVSFTAGSTTLGSVNLDNGVAKLTTDQLPTGSTTVTATYSGSATHQSSSGWVLQVVN